jgi:hypothetical protein
MATGRGPDPGRQGDTPRTTIAGLQRAVRGPADRRRSLLSDIADLEPDHVSVGHRLGAAITLVIVVLVLAAGAGLVVFALFGAIG